MSKRIFYIILFSTAAGLILLYIFFFRTKSNLENLNAFKAVPHSTPVVLKINDPIHFLHLNNTNELINAISTIDSSSTIHKNIIDFTQFINKNEQFYKFLKGKELIVTFNYSGKENINTLTILTLESRSDNDISNKIISYFKEDNSVSIQSRKYNKATITEITKGRQQYFITNTNGLLLFSTKSLLIEEAILQLNLETVENDKELNPLLKTVSKQSDFNLFINHKQIDHLLSKYSSNSLKTKTSLLKTYSGWTELDINVDDNKLSMSGFTNGNQLDNYSANVVLNQQSVNSKIEKILPHSTTFYLSLCLSDAEKYFTDYQSYLDKRNLFLMRENLLLSMEKETGFRMQDVFQDMLEQEVALAGINADQSSPSANKVWIVETKSGSTALNQMIEIQNNYVKNKKLSSSEWIKKYQIDNQTSFNIYQFPYPGLPKTLFGQIFSEMNANWFAVYNNYLIFGDSYITVTKALHSNVLGENLSSNIDYNIFKSNLSARSNITFYCNTSISIPIADLIFNNKVSELIKNNEELRKFKSFAWQVTATGDMLYNNSCLLYNPVVNSKPQTIWQSHMETAFEFKPKFVTNHYDPQNKEVVLVDLNNKFYLINNVGRIIWQIQLESAIKGEVQQIDYFNNGKLQYLFNTQNKIYLIDRNGNSVKNFPITLRSNASSGVSVFDYDNNKDYRFFVACSDQIIYAYSKDGSLLNGWNKFKTDHIVNYPVQHFRVDGKDFIVACDKMKDYILNRQGTIRVTTNEVYQHSANNSIYLEERTKTHEPRMVTTDTNGSLHFTYFDGKHEILNLPKCSEYHYFTAANINSDPEMEYLISDGNQINIFNTKGKVILKQKFDYPVSYSPNIYNFSKDTKKIGVTCKDENKIYLFDIKGKLHSGFPLDGDTQFSIGFISDEMSNFNLLVGSPGGYLYNYYVE